MHHAEESSSALHLEVPGTVDYLDVIRAFVDANARNSGMSEDQLDAVVLAMDEAVANIIEHAYEDTDLPASEQILHIDMQQRDGSLHIRLQDHGKPFDPTVQPGVDLDEHLAEFKTDGLGIHFMRELMDEMRYRYVPGVGNELCMVKRFS